MSLCAVCGMMGYSSPLRSALQCSALFNAIYATAPAAPDWTAQLKSPVPAFNFDETHRRLNMFGFRCGAARRGALLARQLREAISSAALPWAS